MIYVLITGGPEGNMGTFLYHQIMNWFFYRQILNVMTTAEGTVNINVNIMLIYQY